MNPSPIRSPALSPHGSRLGAGERPAVALTVAGSDSGGGAGIQADLKTFHALGVFGTSALTAVTAQDTRGVSAVQVMDPEIVEAQIRMVVEDLEPAAVKSGMLADAATVRTVARALAEAGPEDYVLDPVMVAASGDPLLESDAVDAVSQDLFPLTSLVTPNLDEAAMLLGLEPGEVDDPSGMEDAARALSERGAPSVLLKGGHLAGDRVVDVLLHEGELRRWERERIRTRGSHGTGCTLSAAIAALLARGADLPEAVEGGLAFTRRALEAAPSLGHGSGPLNHWAGAGEEPTGG